MKKLNLSVTFVLFILFGLPLYAQQVIPNGTTQIIASGARNIQMTMDDANNLVVVYNRNTGSGRQEIIGTKYRVDNGTTDIGDFVQSYFVDEWNFDSEYPTVAMASDGSHHVIAWQQSNGADGSGDGIYARLYPSFEQDEDNGSPVFLVNTTTSGDQAVPRAAMDANGDFVIVWISGESSLRGQRYNNSGVKQGSEFVIATINEYSTLYVNYDVAMDDAGNFVVTWISNDDVDRDVYFRRYSATGSAGTKTRVNSSTIDFQIRPKIDMAGNGDFVIYWQSNTVPNKQLFKKYNANLTVAIPDTQIPSVESNIITGDIAMDDNEEFFVTYTSTDRHTFYLKHYSSSGVLIGSEETLLDGSLDVDDIAMAVNKSTHEHVMVGYTQGNPAKVLDLAHCVLRPENLSGPTEVCNSSAGHTYSITPVSGASSYVWTVPNGATITQNNGTSITVTMGQNDGQVTVYASATCGDGLEASLDVNVSEVLGNPGAISGPTDVVENTLRTYSVSEVTAATSYNWTVPAGATIDTDNGNEIIVQFGTSGGNVTVTASDNCGNTSVQSSISVTVDELDVVPPGILSLSPPHNSEGVAVDRTVFNIRFDETVTLARTFTVNLKKAGSKGGPDVNIGVANQDAITFSGKAGYAIAFTILSGDLEAGIDHWIEIPSGAFTDGTNAFPGTDSRTWSFKANRAPTAINLSNNVIDENVAIGTVVGQLTGTDLDVGEDLDFRFVTGTGSTHNSQFSIVNNELRIAVSPDFEAGATRSIRVRVVDGAGEFYDQVFTININDLDEIVPTVASTFPENNAIDVERSPFDIIVSFSEPIQWRDDVPTLVTLKRGTFTQQSWIVNPSTSEFPDAASIIGNDIIFSVEGLLTFNSDYTLSAFTIHDNAGNVGTSDAINFTTRDILTGTDILTFSVDGMIGDAIIDNVNHTITANMDGSASFDISPTVTYSEGAFSALTNATPHTFENGVERIFEVRAESSSFRQNWGINLTWEPASGTYSVGADGYYASLTEAKDDFVDRGIDGDVTLELMEGHVDNGTFVTWPRYTGSDIHNTTITVEDGASTVSTRHYNMTFSGAQNMTVDGKGILVIDPVVVGNKNFRILPNASSEPSENITIRNVSATSENGLVEVQNSTNVQIHNNQFTSGDASVVIGIGGGSEDVTVFSNSIRVNNTTSNATGITIGGSAGFVRVYNNSIELSTTNPGIVFGGISVSTHENLEIYNNTIVSNGTSTGTSGDLGFLLGAGGTSTQVKNNLFSYKGTGTYTGLRVVNGVTGYNFENNNFDIPLNYTRQDYLLIHLTYYDEDDLEFIESQLPGVTTAQTNFTDYGNGDLSLTGSSLNDSDLRGVPIALVETDILGISRSASAPSKGAYEAPNNIAEVTGFTFTNQIGDAVIDIENRTITAQLLQGEDLTSITPTITTFAGSGVSPASGISRDFTNPVEYTVTAEDRTSATWTVTITEQPNNETDITSFSLAQETGPATINIGDNTVQIEVAFGMDVSDLIPTIELSNGATVTPTGAQNFTNPFQYTVTAEDGITSKIWTVTVTIAPNTEAEITSFSISGQVSSEIDGNLPIVTVVMPYGTDVTGLLPTIGVSAEASVSPTTTQDFTNPVVYTVTAEDLSTKHWTVTVTIAPNDEAEITSFNVAGQVSSQINAGLQTVEVVMPYGTNVTSLLPTIGLSAEAGASPTTAQDFTNPVVYTVTAEDLSTKSWTVTVTIAPNDESEITSFSLPGQVSSQINVGPQTIDVLMPYGADVSNLLPTIGVSAEASVSPTTAQDFSTPVDFTVTAEDLSTSTWTVTVTFEPNDESDITSFNIPGQVSSTISAVAPTIEVVMPYGTDVSNLLPTIGVSAEASVSPTIAQDFTNPVVYTVTAEDLSTTDWTVTVTIAPNDEAEITSFSLPGQVSSQVNAGLQTIEVVMPYGTDVTSLLPTIGVSAEAGASPTTAQDFTNPVVYTVTAEDLSTKSWTVTVTIAPNDESEITSFSLPGQVSSQINVGPQTIDVLMPYGFDVSNLLPTISVSAEASVSPTTAQDFSSPVDFTVTAEDLSTSTWTVKVTFEPNDESDITSFNIPGQVSSTISAVAPTIEVVMPYGTDVTSLLPTIGASAEASISPTTAQDFTNPVVYTVTAEDLSTTDWTVTVTIAPNDEAEITSFSLPGQVSSQVNAGLQTIDVVMPFGANVTSLLATIGVSAEAGVSPTTAQDFTSPVVYTVTAEDGSTKDWTVTVTVGPSSDAEIISFSLPGQVSSQINSGSATIDVVMPFGSNISNLLATIGVSIQAGVSPLTAQDYATPVVYTVTAGDGSTKDWTVTVTIAPNDEAEITSFSLPGQVSSQINAGPHTIDVTMPFGSSISNLLATIGLSAQAGVTPITSQDFTNPVVYTVTAGDGSTKDWTVTVTIAPNDEAEIISFNLPGQGSSQINTGPQTIDVVMPFGTDVTNLLASVGVSPEAAVSPTTAQDFTTSVVYTVTAGDGSTKAWTVTITIAPNDESEVTSFSLPGQVSTQINSGLRTIDVVMPYGVDVSNLLPTISVSAEASMTPTVAQDFTNPVVYTITAGDLSTSNWTATVGFAPNDEAEITSFSIPGQLSSTISAGAQTINVVVPFGANISSLLPTIGVSAEAIVSPTSAQDFSTPIVYTVTAEDTSSKDWTVTVTEGAARTDKDIVSFDLADQTGSATINTAQKTVQIEVQFGTDLSKLSPSITVSGGASIAPESDIEKDFSSSVTYTVTAEDGSTQDWTVSVSVADNTENEILTFVLAEQVSDATINSTDKTVSLTVANGTDLMSLVPTISISDSASINPPSGVAQDFSSELTYTVTAENGATQDWTITVSKQLSSAKEIKSFTIDGIAASIDSANALVSIEVGASTDIMTLAPLVTTSAGATVTPSSGTTIDFSDTVDYVVTAEDASVKNWKVVVTKAEELSSAKEIISFSFAEQTGPATIVTNTSLVSIEVVESTDLTSLTPSIGVSEGASVNPGSGISQDFSNAFTYTIMAEDGTSQQWTVEVSVERILSSENDILSFSLPGEVSPASIDSENHSITIEVLGGTDVSALTPTIEVSEGATINPSSGETIDFSNTVSFTVTSEDGTLQSWTVTVEVQVQEITGLNERVSINIFPNPTSDRVRVQMENGSENGIIQLLNIEGSLLKQKGFQGEQEFILSNHPAGIYMIRIIESGSGKIHNNRVLKLD